MTLGVIGFGLIGRERVDALLRLREEGLPIRRILVADPFLDPANVSLPDGVEWVPSVDALRSLSPHWIIVATPHDAAAALVPQLLRSGASVLMEKPMGRSVAEARSILESQASGGRLYIGFNYRFFAGVNALLADLRAGWFGQLVSATMVLGHGGSPGMEKGWKFDPVKAGGGCMIDPGIHLLDLCQLAWGGAVSPVTGCGWRGFWNTGIEEEAHVILRAGEVAINLQVSVVRWRSHFRIEVHGSEGYGAVVGRGRSYGSQSYRRGRRWGWQSTGRSQAESEELVCESDCADSFVVEMRSLLTGRKVNGTGPCTGEEALASMELHAQCMEHIERVGTKGRDAP